MFLLLSCLKLPKQCLLCGLLQVSPLMRSTAPASLQWREPVRVWPSFCNTSTSSQSSPNFRGADACWEQKLLTLCLSLQRVSHWVWPSQHWFPGQPAEGRSGGRVSKPGQTDTHTVWEIPAALWLRLPKFSAGHWGHCEGTPRRSKLLVVGCLLIDNASVTSRHSNLCDSTSWSHPPFWKLHFPY